MTLATGVGSAVEMFDQVDPPLRLTCASWRATPEPPVSAPAHVRCSRIDEPDRSDPGSGATTSPVVVGAVRSMVTVGEPIVTCGPARDEASATVRAARRSRKVPSEQPLTET